MHYLDMALIDKASLLMVPSTYEAGKLYNVLPSGNRAPDSTDQNSGYDQTRADFDFDRGSNAAATRIGSDGLLKKYRENEVLQSNNFDTSPWFNINTTETGGQTGYDGTNNAWLIDINGGVSSQYIGQNVSISGVQTFSVYAKAGSKNWVMFLGTGATIPQVYFDLQNGVVGTEANATGEIVSVGNGWYRCSMWHNQTIGSLRIYIATADNDITQSSGNILIQNAQAESGLVATDVLTSGATTGKAGVLVDLPRINYDANGENGSLLLEPSRVNFVQYSELGTNNSIQGGSITNNEITSPENYTNAFKFLESSANDNHGFYATISLSSNTYYTASIFVKKLGRRYVGLQSWWSSTQGAIAYFDLDDVESKGTYAHGTNYSASDAKIESYGNDWYRISAVFQSGETTHYYGVVSMDSLWTTGTSYTNKYTGDTSKGFYAYGLQTETGSYPSSYIPNHGESGGVTRAADSCNSSSLTTSTDFTIFFEAPNFCLINGGTSTSFDDVQFVFGAAQGAYDAGGSYHIYNNSLYYYNGSTNTSFGAIYNNQTDSKFALVKRGNQGIIYANGVKKTEVTLPSGADAKVINWDTISLTEGGLADAQGDVFGSNYKQLVKFDEALTDSELATLTTL